MGHTDIKIITNRDAQSGSCGCVGLDIVRGGFFASSCVYDCACGIRADIDMWDDGVVTQLAVPVDRAHQRRAEFAYGLDTLCGAVTPSEVAAMEQQGVPLDWAASWTLSQRRA